MRLMSIRTRNLKQRNKARTDGHEKEWSEDKKLINS